MHHHKNQLPNRHPINRRPLDAATERYRVRDKDWAQLWADNLSYDEAIKMRDQLIAAKRSKTARVESMSVEPPEWWVAEQTAELPDLGAQPEEAPREVDPEGEVDSTALGRQTVAPPPKAVGVEYRIDGGTSEPITITKDGVIRRVPPSHDLSVNGVLRVVPTAVTKGDVVTCVPVGPALAAARAAAADAVSKVIRDKRKIPLDYTVKPSEPRRVPPPADTTVKVQPQVIRLVAPAPAPARPQPSPLKVAMIPDGDPLADDALTDSDLPDLATDLGGGPSDADLDHARRQAEAERSGR